MSKPVSEWRYSVIEYQQKKSEIILIGQASSPVKSVWNIVYTAPFDPIKNDELQAFEACEVWLEQNKVDGSNYIITEMFFV